MVDFLMGPAEKIQTQVNRELIEMSKAQEDKDAGGGSTKWGMTAEGKDEGPIGTAEKSKYLVESSKALNGQHEQEKEGNPITIDDEEDDKDEEDDQNDDADNDDDGDDDDDA